MSENIETLVIIETPPFSHIAGKEGVDLALVCAAFEQQVHLTFVDEGIFHLLNNQNENYFEDKLHDKQLKALEYYDIENIYVEYESMQRFGLVTENLIDTVKVITAQNINELCHTSQQTVTF